MDPLSNYDYSYSNYDQMPTHDFMYSVKMEPLHQAVTNHIPDPYANMYPTDYQNNDKPVTGTENQVTESNNDIGETAQGNENQKQVDEEDSKEHLKYLTEPKRRLKRKGKTSTYWNKKVEDKNFPFYGCTICNVSFSTIQDLDQHVTVHKGRITSYDIRVRNQIKRKEKIKEMKRLKKLGKKIKTEGLTDIEIKPEDGYIGNEEASKYNDSEKNDHVNNENTDINSENVNQNVVNNENGATTASKRGKGGKKNNKKSKLGVPEDPRLLKLFKCFACQKQFSLSYYLKLHVRSHTDEKPYTCAECGQSFITASKLGRHNKRIHLAIKFQCRICYRFFSRFDILTRHFDKAHKEEKLEGEPYDYNAILPYLKELEEQLREKADKDKIQDQIDPKTEDEKTAVNEKTVEDQKSKSDPWPFAQSVNKDSIDVLDNKGLSDDLVQGDNPYLEDKDRDRDYEPEEEILVEAVKVLPEAVDIKEEDQEESQSLADIRDDSFSDDDYFPSNTWAATPKIELPPTTAPPKKRKQSEFPIKCEMCEKIIKTPSYYRVHLRTHSGEKPFSCYICKRGFITSSKMHRHVLTHDEHRSDKDLDVVKTEDGAEVKEETDEEETRTNKKKKNVTKEIILGKKSTGRKKREYRKRPHACLYCNKRFLHRETLYVHKKCHEGETLVLKCNFCLEVMPDEDTLRDHEQEHTGPKPYLCTICLRSYTKREAMVYHRKSHGEDPKEKNEFVCDICSKSFNAKCKLQRHIISHKVDKFVLRYECPVCAHMFNTKYHVQMHLSTHMKEGLIMEENRSEILAMVLQNARKIPKKTDATDNFTYLIPADERSRVCNICGQVFQHFYYLEEHLKSHGSKIAIEDDTKAEDKKHICPVCNKGFKLHYLRTSTGHCGE
ncbi:zinc finger protein 567-like isoform X3 [Pectinophora gossypiella]|uniref:zinc finger protein 567-like isoform X3 n=1 Tax=Pectinophora gossypiella TaxID=13191 RepID=UPI00214EEBEA|nr:zinc finger protein 567-like isoform X3 [Pectinophora gossypiella]